MNFSYVQNMCIVEMLNYMGLASARPIDIQDRL